MEHNVTSQPARPHAAEEQPPAGGASPSAERPTLAIGSDVEIARRLKAELEHRHGPVKHVDGQLWHFDATHWESFEPEALRRRVHDYDGALYPKADGRPNTVLLSKNKVDSVLRELAAIAAAPDFFALEDAPVGINCRSGFIRFDPATGAPALEPHAPEHRRRHVLAACWSPDAASEPDAAGGSRLAKLLAGSFLGDEDLAAKVDLVAEIAGAAALGAVTGIRERKAIVLQGATAGNGKSQVLDLVRFMLPKEAVASIPPGEFGDSRMIIGLAGKLLNAADELTSADAIASDRFKNVITGEPVTGRDVYKSLTTFRPTALHLFATNDLPSFRGGMDRGVQRRLLVLPFNRTIPVAEREDRIGRKIAEFEPDRLLEFAVEGAARFIRQGGFTEPASSRAALTEWVRGADPVQAWLGTVKIVPGSTARVRMSEAHKHFKAWAVEEGFRADGLPAVTKFAQRVRAARSDLRFIHPQRRSIIVGLVLPSIGDEAVDDDD